MGWGRPHGWFAITPLRDLPVGTVRRVVLDGRERVLWRGEDGGVRLQGATCPHLGAHLAEGGEVVGDTLRCPFHGFRFDGAGACVATGYGTRPPGRARLATVPLAVRHGVVFAWVDPADGPPAWALPEGSDEGWRPLSFHRAELRTHPQDITENSVDIGHFSWVHGYDAVEVVDPLRVDGPVLRTRYRFRRPVVPGLSARMTQEIDLHVHGLGYSRVEVTQRDTGARLRLWVLPTLLEEGRTQLLLGLSLPRRGALGWVGSLAQPLALLAYVHDVQQDVRIWENKVAVRPPALARGDGPIGRYQAWASRFYGAADAGRQVG